MHYNVYIYYNRLIKILIKFKINSLNYIFKVIELVRINFFFKRNIMIIILINYFCFNIELICIE